MDGEKELNLLDGYQVFVKLGDETVTVKAMCIEDSRNWSNAWHRKVGEIQAEFAEIANKMVGLSEINSSNGDDRRKLVEQNLSVQKEMADFADRRDRILCAVGHLAAHGIPEDKLKKATTLQITEAFRAVYQLENPPGLTMDLTGKTTP